MKKTSCSALKTSHIKHHQSFSGQILSYIKFPFNKPSVFASFSVYFSIFLELLGTSCSPFPCNLLLFILGLGHINCIQITLSITYALFAFLVSFSPSETTWVILFEPEFDTNLHLQWILICCDFFLFTVSLEPKLSSADKVQFTNPSGDILNSFFLN